MLIGYVRVPTAEQNPDAQHDALNAAGCWRIFTDHASGTRADGPALTTCLEQLRPGDTLVVTKLDRLGGDALHLTETVTTLASRGAGSAPSPSSSIPPAPPGDSLPPPGAHRDRTRPGYLT